MTIKFGHMICEKYFDMAKIEYFDARFGTHILRMLGIRKYKATVSTKLTMTFLLVYQTIPDINFTPVQ